MRVDLVDPVTESIPEGWDVCAVRGSLSVLWQAQPLAVADWSGLTPSLMGVAYDGDTPVALFHGRLQGFSDPRQFHVPGRTPTAGIFECRLYPGSLTGYHFDAVLDAAGRRAAVAAFEAAVRRRFGWRVLGFAYRHVTPETLHAVEGRWRRTQPVLPELTLFNQWADPGQYRASLAGKWRSQLRKIQATVREDASLTVELRKDVPVAEAARLVDQVRTRKRRPGMIGPPIADRFFALLNDDPGTEFVTYWTEERLLAMSTVHDTGTDMLMTFWGTRERTEGGRHGIYFDQFLRMVDLMIDRGRTALLFGKGMNAIKERFGTVPQPRFAVIGR